MVSGHGLDSVQLRDARYDQIIHMVTAANGAEPFYQLTNNSTRTEGFQLARELDAKAAQVGQTGLSGLFGCTMRSCDNLDTPLKSF